MKKIDSDDFRVHPGKTVHLEKWPTRVKPVYSSREEYESLLAEHTLKLSEQQSRLYADDSYALLLIFQAMDAAGKDSVIKHVMSGVNPQGCSVYSFKHPSGEELQHDFLWRTTRALPERGRIGIFNRSYYEEVLILRVHPELLRNEAVPDPPRSYKKLWEHRYRSINGLERHLHANGTRILKFFLHISKEEQGKRFLDRIEKPDKNWKFSMADIEERAYWDDYRAAYEKCLSATSTEDCPWHVVPADDKLNARLFVSNIILDAMKALDISYPKTDATRQRELEACRQKLLEKD